MKRIRTAAVAAIALAGVPVAHAQATCSDINRLLAEADSDFGDIVGDETEEDVFEATFQMTGGRECYVDLSFDSVYGCYWAFTSADVAVRFVDAQVATMRGCLKAGAWTETPLGPNEPSSEWRLLKGAEFEGDALFSDMILQVRADTRLYEGREVFEAEVSLSYLYF